MEINRASDFVLTRKDESDIIQLCEIARLNGATLSLKEVLQLTSLEATQEEVEHAWGSSPVLGSRYVLESGLILEKGFNDNPLLRKEEEERKARATKNIEFSKSLSLLLGNRGIRSLLISGSTSYFSVSESDDLDFFTIAGKDRVWLFLTRSLLLLRAKKIASLRPDVCLSYTGDEGFARQAFLFSRSGLFARDALTALPIFGSDYYLHMLESCTWMASFFPKVYRARLNHSAVDQPARESHSSIILRIVNMALYFTVGNYVRMKSYILNRRFAKLRKFDRIFRLRIGLDHCIYEARSYRELSRMYRSRETYSG